MNSKIGIISDPHATPGPVEEALAIFQREGVKGILCAGDIAGYGTALEETVGLLVRSGCRGVSGNHEAWYLARDVSSRESATYRYLDNLPVSLEMNIEGRALYMVHASPPDQLMDGIRLLDETGAMIDEQLAYWSGRLKELNHDVLVVGHTHQVFAERIAGRLVINPGSTLFNHSCAVLSFPGLGVEWYGLSGMAIKKSWNWGMDFVRPGS
ncbi:MAG: metallophosphoesterase family protein [Candidatus Sedimenticola sp. 20ELBAFRAG]